MTYIVVDDFVRRGVYLSSDQDNLVNALSVCLELHKTCGYVSQLVSK